MTNATDWLSRYIPTRAVVLGIAIWMTWKASAWAMWFATGNPRDGLEMAAIIAAVTAPITAFGGYVFKAYLESKST